MSTGPTGISDLRSRRRPDSSTAATSVLMLDGESRFALGVLRCLGNIPGFRTHIISQSPGAEVRFSRYCASFHLRSVEADWEEGLWEVIEQIVAKTAIDVFLPVGENAAIFVAKRAARLARLGALHPVADADTIATCEDKWRFAQFAMEHNIPVPPTKLFTGHARDDLASLDPGARVLLKPRISSNGRGIVSFASGKEAELFLDSHAEMADEFIAQTFTNGYVIDCSALCREGTILAHTIQKAIFPGTRPFQVAAGIEFLHHDEVLETSRKLLSALGWSGVAHVDTVYNPAAASVTVLEVNARYWGSLLGSLHAGINFPRLACQTALGIPFDSPGYCDTRYFTGPGLARQWLAVLRGADWPPHSPAASAFRYVGADARAALMVALLRQR